MRMLAHPHSQGCSYQMIRPDIWTDLGRLYWSVIVPDAELVELTLGAVNLG